jgi:hypothetical protein
LIIKVIEALLGSILNVIPVLGPLLLYVIQSAVSFLISFVLFPIEAAFYVVAVGTASSVTVTSATGSATVLSWLAHYSGIPLAIAPLIVYKTWRELQTVDFGSQEDRRSKSNPADTIPADVYNKYQRQPLEDFSLPIQIALEWTQRMMLNPGHSDLLWYGRNW